VIGGQTSLRILIKISLHQKQLFHDKKRDIYQILFLSSANFPAYTANAITDSLRYAS
jgi:hypothetical protein